MAKEVDFTKLSDEDLDAYQFSLSDEKAKLREKGLEVQKEVDQRAILRKVNQFSDEEKAALAQVIGIKSIPSEEKVSEAN